MKQFFVNTAAMNVRSKQFMQHYYDSVYFYLNFFKLSCIEHLHLNDTNL